MPEKPDLTEGTSQKVPLVSLAFMFTDVVGSSQLMERDEEACKAALSHHDEILRAIAARQGGVELAEAGDGFLFAFENPADAAAAALQLQQNISDASWPGGVDGLEVRVALGWGEVTPIASGEFRGLVLNRTARLLAAIHGGQTVCGSAFAEAAGESLQMQELGWYLLRELVEPEQVFQLGEARRFPPLNATAVVSCNLPRTFTSFVGREKEIRELASALDLKSGGNSIVTITGPGGSGKTRLSIATGEQLRGFFNDAVWLVPLADLSEPALLPLALRDALRLPTDSADAPVTQVAKFLRARPALLILDNFEQLLPAGADLLCSLTSAAPNLRLLVSSRIRLGVPGESEFALRPLAVPGANAGGGTNFPAVQLFADRARAVRPNFELTAENTEVVSEICRMLEGMPLAIELAASRADVIAPAEMLGELERRLSFCVSENPQLPARHRSLRAAIDWSYDFLPAGLKSFFESLAVFRRGWTAEAASAVAHSKAVEQEAGQTRRALGELRASSLVHAEEVGGRMRFHMLETVRQYAAEKLELSADAEAVRTRHAAFFRDLAERAEAHVHTAAAATSLGQLDEERENLRASLVNSRDAETLARLATALTPYWIARGLVHEGRIWLNRCETETNGLQFEMRAAVRYCSGTLAVQQADWAAAQESFTDALSQFRAIGHEENVAALLCNLGIVAAHQRDLPKARQTFLQALEIYERVNHPTREALALINLGTVLIDLGELDNAAYAHERALKLTEATADEGAGALALQGLAQVKFHLGELGEARSLAEASLSRNRNLKQQPRLAENAMLLACCSPDAQQAARWLGAAEWLTLDSHALPSLRLESAADEVRARIRSELAASIFAQESATGRRMARVWCGEPA